MATNLKKRGSALITALFIMTLVAIAATAMSVRLQLDIYRTGLTLRSDKLYLASQAIAFWALESLAQNTTFKPEPNSGATLAVFPVKMQTIYPGVLLSGGLYDMQASFNLNNVQNRKFYSLFINLLGNTLKKSNVAENTALYMAILNWISPYQPGRGNDEFMAYYAHQQPPYLPGYQFMQSVSEFRLVRGVNQEIYQTLLPYVTVLPTVTAININTAPKQILMSLGNGLNESQLEEFIEARDSEEPIRTEKLNQVMQKFNIPKEQITTISEYFLCMGTASAEDLNLTTYTLIKRTKDAKGRISITIISESMNTL